MEKKTGKQRMNDVIDIVAEETAIDFAKFLLMEYHMGVFEDNRTEDLCWQTMSVPPVKYSSEDLYKIYLKRRNGDYSE